MAWILVGSSVSALAAGTVDDRECAPTTFQDQPACRQADGTLWLLGSAGEPAFEVRGDGHYDDGHQYFSHHMGQSAPAVHPPHCIREGETYYVQVLFAELPGYTSSKDWVAEGRRELTELNTLIHERALEDGVTVDLRTPCDAAGDPVIPYELGDGAAQNFGDVKLYLDGHGYDDPRVKYWMLFDTMAAVTSGAWEDDDRPVLDNLNNGAAPEAMWSQSKAGFAFDHEALHTLGAVQHSAPHSDSGPHCYDQYDVMCYFNNHQYLCESPAKLDCGKDDYFHAAPAAGSYLATHWNVASELNRYLQRDRMFPIAKDLACTATPGGLVTSFPQTLDVACTWTVDDPDSTGVRYEIDWGDGTLDAYPAAGHAATGSQAQVVHSYAGARPDGFTVKVRATDDGTVPMVNGWQAVDRTLPGFLEVEPRPARLYDSWLCQPSSGTNGVDLVEGATGPLDDGAAVFIDLGCYAFEVDDADGHIGKVVITKTGACGSPTVTLDKVREGQLYLDSWDLCGTGSGPMSIEVHDSNGNIRVHEVLVEHYKS